MSCPQLLSPKPNSALNQLRGLSRLLRQQRTKIEEIKKKTNYYTTRNLLERYDESPSSGGAGAAASDPTSTFRPRMPGGPPTTPQRQGQPSNANPQTPSKVQTRQQASISSALQNQLAGTSVSLLIVPLLNDYVSNRHPSTYSAPSQAMVR